MERSTLLAFAALMTGAAHVHAQTALLESIITQDKVVPTVNQTLSGTWMSELRRPGPAGLLPPIPNIITFFPDGSSLGSPADGNQTPTHAIWIRVGDRKFLGTGFFFAFNENRTLTTITKVRINYHLSADGKTLTGTTEAVLMDRDGKVINTFPGSTSTMVRLGPELPADFYDFQKIQ